MGRRRLSERLNVFMNGQPVGYWEVGRESRFTYLEEWTSNEGSRPISLSLPISALKTSYSGPLVDAFFDNLLPNSDVIRRRIQSRFGTSGTGPFELLSEIGRDCVGALQLVPENKNPADVNKISGEPLNESGIATTLRQQAGTGNMLGQKDEEFRISLAGAQEKTALLYRDGIWQRPTGSTPTTHIFKRPLGIVGHQGINLSTSLENEWLCLKILEGFGLPVPKCHIESFEQEKSLIVERFDRKLSTDGSWWIRLPQEDFCQATGSPPGLKYQSDGGPGIRNIATILGGSVTAEEDKATFIKAQILFWLLAATDGHAKNFSVFILPKGRFRLTPLYDVISTYPVLGHGTGLLHPTTIKMAMAVRGTSGNRYKWSTILRRHWINTARDGGLSRLVVETIIDEIIEQTPNVLSELEKNLPEGFPDIVADKILGGVRISLSQLKIHDSM